MADHEKDSSGPKTQHDGEPSAGRADDNLAFAPVQRRQPRSRAWLVVLITFLIAGVAGAGGWYGWGQNYFMGTTQEITIIRAAEGPVKTRPKVPGGLVVPNRDKLVYERLETKPPVAKTETLLPRPEVPLPPPEQKAAVSPAPAPVSVPVPAPSPTPPAAVPESKPPAAAPVIPTTERPSPMEVLTARKPPPAPPPPNAPAANTVPAASPPPAAKPITPKAVPSPPQVLQRPSVSAPAPSSPQIRSAPPALSPRPSSVTPPTVDPGVPRGGEFRIQVAAVRSEVAAREEWKRLQTKHTDLLGPLRLEVVRADLGSKGVFFRLRAGPIASLPAARTLCAGLAKQKVGCLVVPPGR